jgi:DNA-binding response OmpR family regulator
MSCISLVVEDQPDIRKLIRMTLEFEDFEIHEVGDAPAAVTFARAMLPDLVLLDVMMPGEFDGLEACRRLRADPHFARTRIILLSARGQSSDIEAGFGAGADAYVLKPFSPIKLLDTIRECMNRGAAAPLAEGVR